MSLGRGEHSASDSGSELRRLKGQDARCAGVGGRGSSAESFYAEEDVR